MKDNICKYCSAVNSHFSFQCRLKPKKETGKQAKPKVKIKQVSDKRLKELAIYRKVRDKFLKDNPVCQYPNCNSTEVTCHHPEGRIGNNLIDASKFKSLCWPHHKWCEENSIEAKKLGLSADRL